MAVDPGLAAAVGVGGVPLRDICSCWREQLRHGEHRLDKGSGKDFGGLQKYFN